MTGTSSSTRRRACCTSGPSAAPGSCRRTGRSGCRPASRIDPLRRRQRAAHALSAPRLEHGLPGECAAIAVSPLLRELILRRRATGMLDERDPVEAALAMLDRRRVPPGAALRPSICPQPSSPALRSRRRADRRERARAASTPQLARAVGLGVRTLERRFLAETGMSPGRWRRQHALLGALERLRRHADQAGRRRCRLCHAQRLHRRLPRQLRHHARPLFRRSLPRLARSPPLRLEGEDGKPRKRCADGQISLVRRLAAPCSSSPARSPTGCSRSS